MLLYIGPGDADKPFDLRELLEPNRQSIPLAMIEDLLPDLVRTGSSEWANRATGETLSLAEVVGRYGHFFPPSATERVPAWLKDIQQSINVRFIKTNRLLSRAPYSSRTRPERIQRNAIAVMDYSHELASTTREILAKSVELSSALDRSFPLRLVERIREERKPELSVDDLRQRLHQLDEKRARLTNAGLLEKEQGEVQLPDEEVNDFTRIVLSIYAQDVLDKLIRHNLRVL